MKLSIITLTYNKLKYTKKYIDSLFKYTKDFELIIVDNGSCDGTREYLKSLNNVKLIFNDENVGFSKGNNQGLEIAEGEYIGFLNNDILLSPNWFEECEKVFIKGDNTAFVSPTQLCPKFENVTSENYIENFIPSDSFYKTFDDCQFACVITKRAVLNNVGIFDENFSPAFFEDNDLKCSAIEKGYNTYVTKNACFFHYSSVTSAKLNQKFEDNRLYFYKKHRFAEYLTIYANENQVYKEKARAFETGFLAFVYKIYLFVQKVKRNLKRMFKK